MQDRQCQPGGSAFQVCPLAHCLQRLPVPVMPTTPEHRYCGRRQKVGEGGVLQGSCPFTALPPPSFASHSNKCCHPPCICCPLYWQVPDLYTTAAQKQQKALTGHHCMLFCLVYVMPLFTSTHDCSLAYNSARTTFMLQRLTVVT